MLSFAGPSLAPGAARRIRSRLVFAALGLAPAAGAAVHTPAAPDPSPSPFPGFAAPSSTAPAPNAAPSEPTPAPAEAVKRQEEDSPSTQAIEQEEPAAQGATNPASATPTAEADTQTPTSPPEREASPPAETPATETPTPGAETTTASPPPCPAPSDEEAPPSPFKSILLLEAVGRYGLLGRGSGLLDSETDEPIDETFTAGYFGGQATFGLMPSHSAFTLAGRLRGGSYIGGGLSAGSLGAAVLFGANFARNDSGDSFSYALGGFGVEFMPAANTDMLTFNASGGTIMNGFNLSAGLDLGINDDLFVAFFGLQVGWGQLFK